MAFWAASIFSWQIPAASAIQSISSGQRAYRQYKNSAFISNALFLDLAFFDLSSK
jgi:hypothetical protein